jgi:hypothetical protein
MQLAQDKCPAQLNRQERTPLPQSFWDKASGLESSRLNKKMLRTTEL